MRKIGKKLILGTVLAGLCAGIAFAAATGDRLKAPVQIGQGQAVATQLVFDIGSGSSNPRLQSTSGGSLQLSTNGSNFLTIPAITDTAVGLAATQTLTNKTLTSPTINGGTISGGTVGGTVSTLSGGTLSGNAVSGASISGSTFTDGAVTGSTAGDSVLTLSNTSTGQGIVLKSGQVAETPFLGTTSADDLFFKADSFPAARVAQGGGMEIYGTNSSTMVASAGAALELHNNDTSTDVILRTGTVSTDAVIGTTTANDMVVVTNNSEVLRAKNGGGVNITGTGGNTPHACQVRSTSVSGSGNQSCSAGEIATGGGCFTSNTVEISSPNVSSGTPTGWACTSGGGGTVIVYAVCCQY